VHLREERIDALASLVALFATPDRGTAEPVEQFRGSPNGLWVQGGNEFSRPGGIGALLDLGSYSSRDEFGRATTQSEHGDTALGVLWGITAVFLHSCQLRRNFLCRSLGSLGRRSCMAFRPSCDGFLAHTL
jgi:hypothetical protein